MSDELEIPAGAETALAFGNARRAIRLTVAAELDRIAAELEQMAVDVAPERGGDWEADAYGGVARTLRARAAQLRDAR